MASGKPVRKRRTTKKPAAKSVAAKRGAHVEILAIILLGFSLLCFFGIFFTDLLGGFGEALRNLVFMFFGKAMGMIFPFACLAYSIALLLKSSRVPVFRKTPYIIIFMMILSAFFATYDYNLKHGLAFSEVLKAFIDALSSEKGGGLFGNLIAWPLIALMNKAGTFVVLSVAGLIDFIVWTGLSFKQFFIGVGRLIAWFGRSVYLFFSGVKKDVDSFEEEKNTSTRANNEKENIQPQVKKNKKTGYLLDDPKLPEDEGVEPPAFMQGKHDIRRVKPSDFEQKDFRKDFVIDGASEVRHNTASPFEEPIELRDDPAQYVQPTLDDVAIKEEHKNLDEDLCKDVVHTGNSKYELPSADLLKTPDKKVTNASKNKQILMKEAEKLENTLKSFNVDAKVVNVTKGPAVTRYEVQPSLGVKVSRIVGLADDIALNLASHGIRIEAPIPGKAAVGIEVPNKDGDAVYLKELIDTDEFRNFSSLIPFAVGKGISGNTVVYDLAKMPHVLIAGATGSGKSVCINSILMSILYKASSDEVKLVLIDPKVVELGIYNGIPHLSIPVVTNPHGAAGALKIEVGEMEKRYRAFADKGVRDMKGYNDLAERTGEFDKLPQRVIIIDELADLMMVAAKDVEESICRLAQMARAAGMHLVLATQRPSVDVITGIIKANIPSRIAFAVSSQVDSRTILDGGGAEKLLGKGDMLFYPTGESKPIRIKGCFVSDSEVEKVVAHVKQQGTPEYNKEAQDAVKRAADAAKDKMNPDKDTGAEDSVKEDPMFNKAADIVLTAGQASVSMLQRRLGVGYARAGKLVDMLEEKGIIGRHEGSKPRQLLISKGEWYEKQMRDEVMSEAGAALNDMQGEESENKEEGI